MKPLLLLKRITFAFCVCVASITNLISQDFCDGSSSTATSRTHFGCPDPDELTAEEVLAMPIMYIPVVFHFNAYHDTPTNTDVNFVCSTSDPLYSMNQYLFAPTFVYYVMVCVLCNG